MFKKTLDVVKTIGNSIKEAAIEGEYLGKGGVVIGGTMLSLPAFAAVDAAVTTALSTALTDVGTVGSAVFVVIIAAAAFKLLRRAV